MAFKLNISHCGRALKIESGNEELVGTTIGSTIDGKMLSGDLEGYELLVTGTSDKAGFPGIKDVKGPALKRIILKRGIGMKNNQEGLRLRKTIRGNEISADTVQVNLKVQKEGKKKFEDILPKKENSEKSSSG